MITQKLRRKSFRLTLMGLILLIALIGTLVAAPAAFADSEEEAFLTIINNYRQNSAPGHPLPLLTQSSSLHTAAFKHNFDMATHGYFAHTSPVDGSTFISRIRAEGYYYNTWLGENLAAGTGNATAQQAFNSWFNSAGHKANMDNPNYHAIGISRYYLDGSQWDYYWTTDFGGVATNDYVSVDADLTDKWNDLGGAPGGAIAAAVTITGGKYQDFVNGRLVKNDAAVAVYWVHGAILDKYKQYGGDTGFLGLPTSDEYGVTGGRANDFAGGKIYWSLATWSHEVHGPILEKFVDLGGTAAFGFPMSDVTSITAAGATGVLQGVFQGGNIYAAEGVTAHEVHGAILAKYLAVGGPYWRGLPTSDEQSAGVAGARYNSFVGGNVYWSLGTGANFVYAAVLEKYMALGDAPAYGLPTADTGAITAAGATGALQGLFQGGRIYAAAGVTAHEVHGAILGKYLAVGGPYWRGLPTNDEMDAGAAGARYSSFATGGNVYWSPGTGASFVYGSVLTNYTTNQGGPSGFLGLPTADTTGISVPWVTGALQGFFQNGRIYSSNETGTYEVHGAILAKYLALGGPWVYGMPQTNEITAGSNGKWNQFQYANIYWSPGTGSHEVHGAIRETYVATAPGGAGGPTGILGFPTSDERHESGTWWNNFEQGYIIWTPAAGTIIGP